MLRSIKDDIWFFDCEWIPDVNAGRLLYGLPAELSAGETLKAMWELNGATPETPQPFLKTVLCRVISIAVVRRRRREGQVLLDFLWLPRDVNDPIRCSEDAVVGTFLQQLGKAEAQIVGFNSRNSDLKILLERAVINGIAAPQFCARPNKPWEGRDYFARDNEYHIDLMELLGGWGGRGAASLNEIATLSGIPGKFEAAGEQVAQMWLDGRLQDVVRYNCFDALTTYLLWLRIAHLDGHLTAEEYEEEQGLLNDRLLEEAERPECEFFNRYLDEWERLKALQSHLKQATLTPTRD